MKRTIGVKDLGEAFKRRWKTLLFTILICVLIGGIIGYLIPATYEAESDLLINSSVDNKEFSISAKNDIEMDLRLVETYKQIMQSDRLVSKVNSGLGNLYTKTELSNKIKIKVGNGSQIITIIAYDTTPEKAANLANVFAKVSQEEIKTLMGLDNITILKDIRAEIDTEKNEHMIIYYIILSFIVGVLVGIVTIILKEVYSPYLDTDSKVEESLGLPLLGSISKLSYRKRVIGKKSQDSPSRIELSLSTTENFSKLAANIYYLIVKKEVKIIMMVSRETGDGKTFIGCNLATRLALNGKRTIFIDANLRKSDGRMHFDLPERKGLTSVISGFYGLGDVIQNTETENLSFISTGPLPPNPAQFLQSEKLNGIFQELKELFDVIIIDAPALEFADAVGLLPTVDGCIYIANTQRTKEGKALQSMESLKNYGGDILGVVLNYKEKGLV